jgi:hypothetical protein
MHTIITVKNPAVHTPSQEYLQYVADTYLTPGKLVIEEEVDSATGHSTTKLHFSSKEAYTQFNSDPTILAERELGTASVVKRNIYRVYQQPI